MMETTFGPQSLKYSTLWPFTEKKIASSLSTAVGITLLPGGHLAKSRDIVGL